MRDLDEVSGTIVKAAYQLHTDLGPGMLESVYEVVLMRMLEQKGLKVERQKEMPFTYRGIYFQAGFRADLIVEDQILVELKSADKLAGINKRQVLTYLRLLDLRIGLLINFGAEHLNDGLQRIVNRHVPSPDSPLRVARRDALAAGPAADPPAVPPRTSATPASSARECR